MNITTFKKIICACRSYEKYFAMEKRKINRHMEKWYNVKLNTGVENAVISEQVVSEYLETITISCH